MPEGPEIEVMRLGLAHMAGTQLNRIVQHREHRKVTFTKSQLARLRRTEITAVERRGKVLAIVTRRGSVIVGAGMSGYWRWIPATEGIERWKHDIFSLECAFGTAIFNDTRRFGSAKIVPAGDTTWADHLGLEGLSAEDMLAPGAGPRLSARFSTLGRRELKPALLDQSRINGIGNIYASEICFRLGRHPAMLVGDFYGWNRLGRVTYAVLTSAVRGKGTTLRFANPYQTPDGSVTNGLRLHVYDRTDSPCDRCGTPIIQFTQAGRSTYYCPVCQPEP